MQTQTIFEVNKPFTWLREPLFRRLPDGSLCCVIFTGGRRRRNLEKPEPTGIPNPGAKPRIINLPDGRIVLFHNPNEKDYDDVKAHGHKYRTPLEMWISDDGMQTWGLLISLTKNFPKECERKLFAAIAEAAREAEA